MKLRIVLQQPILKISSFLQHLFLCFHGDFYSLITKKRARIEKEGMIAGKSDISPKGAIIIFDSLSVASAQGKKEGIKRALGPGDILILHLAPEAFADELSCLLQNKLRFIQGNLMRISHFIDECDCREKRAGLIQMQKEDACLFF